LQKSKEQETGVMFLKRAVSYARYSSTNHQDISIEAQFACIEEFVKQNGYVTVARYEDKAISGFSSRRLGLMQLLEDTKKEDLIQQLSGNLQD